VQRTQLISKGKAKMDKDKERLVWGAEGIGKAIDRSERQTFHLLKKGRLPAWKVGTTWAAKLSHLLDPAKWPTEGRQ
jgi:hypothetical protein